MKKLLCRFGFHNWKMGPSFIIDIEGKKWDADPNGPYKPFRTCTNCNKRQSQLGNWGWV